MAIFPAAFELVDSLENILSYKYKIFHGLSTKTLFFFCLNLKRYAHKFFHLISLAVSFLTAIFYLIIILTPNSHIFNL